MKVRLTVPDWACDIFVVGGTLFIAGLVALDSAVSCLKERRDSAMYLLRMAILGVGTLGGGAIQTGWALAKKNLKRLWLVLLALAVFAVGCTGRPMSTAEMFPQWNRDPLQGLWIVEGSAPFNFEILDQANRVVASGGDSGTSPLFTFNGRSPVRLYESDQLHLRLSPGYYTVNVRSFYWATTITGRYPQRLYNQTYGLTVTSNNPSACPDDQYTHWDWGWCLRIFPGDIPQRQPPDAISFPQINMSGTGIIGDALEWLRRR